MAQCPHCGAPVGAQDRFCQNCGSALAVQPTRAEDPWNVQPAAQTTLNGMPVQAQAAQAPASAGNVVAGIVGALLFSLGGAAIYFLLYQINVVSAISGVVMFVLANKGYRVFSRATSQKAGIVTAALVTLVMIFAAEYFCIGWEIWKAWRSEGIDLTDALRVVPAAIQSDDVKGAFLKELLTGYLFAGIGLVSALVSAVKKNKTT